MSSKSKNEMYSPDRNIAKPSPSTVKKPGTTGPISKPSPSTFGKPGVTGPGSKPKGGK